MERRAKAPHGRGYEHPSFSSTLLDAIYRSIDDEREQVDGRGAVRDPGAAGALDLASVAVAAPKKPIPSTVYINKESTERRALAQTWERTADRRRGGLPPISTSSSSDNSSYGGFSSSEPESATANRLRPVRTAGLGATVRSSAAPSRPPALSLPRSIPSLPSPAEAAVAHPQERKKSNSLRSKLRDLRKSKGPASPGARLAGFLNALFAAGGSPRKSKSSPAVVGGAAAGGWDESACSTASLHSRSCLSKTPSSRGAREEAVQSAKRSVRFHPVGLVVEENLRPNGQKRASESHLTLLQQPSATAPSKKTPAKEGRREWETKMRVEELLRGLEDDDEEDGSDSSSDLFELEIRVGGAGAGLGYRDELPVYGTTRHPLGPHRPISHHY